MASRKNARIFSVIIITKQLQRTTFTVCVHHPTSPVHRLVCAFGAIRSSLIVTLHLWLTERFAWNSASAPKAALDEHQDNASRK